jgi:hypothetical protein
MPLLFFFSFLLKNKKKNKYACHYLTLRETTMKKLLAALALGLVLSTQAFAQSEVCAALHDLAVHIAEGRDRSVPLGNIYAGVDQVYADRPTSAIEIKGIADSIYESPSLTPKEAGAAAMLSCKRNLVYLRKH